jgi:uncharacterized membrane protein
MFTMPFAFLGICVLIIVLSIPLIQKKVKRNGIYGFRLPKSMSNDERWYKSNWFAGWALLISAIITAILLTAIIIFYEKIDPENIPNYCIYSIMVPLFLSIATSLIYLKKLP